MVHLAVCLLLSIAVFVLSHSEHEGTPSMTPGDVEKMVCKVAGNKLVEDMVTSKICEKVDKHFNITIPECQSKAEKVWDTLAKICPRKKEHELLFSRNEPKPWVKAFCKVAWNKWIEHATTSKFCASAHQTLNITIPNCQTKAEQVWDTLAKECPHEKELEVTSSMTPGDVEKMVCKVAGNKLVEDMVTSKICEKVDKHFNITIPDCQSKAEKVWDTLANMCPQGSTDVSVVSSPNDIEGIFCAVAGNKFIEDAVAKNICRTVRTALKITAPECEAHAEKVWDGFAEQCPKIHKSGAEAAYQVRQKDVVYV